eukprot:5931545-Amphidinium_carterae.1
MTTVMFRARCTNASLKLILSIALMSTSPFICTRFVLSGFLTSQSYTGPIPELQPSRQPKDNHGRKGCQHKSKDDGGTKKRKLRSPKDRKARSGHASKPEDGGRSLNKTPIEEEVDLQPTNLPKDNKGGKERQKCSKEEGGTKRRKLQSLQEEPGR